MDNEQLEMAGILRIIAAIGTFILKGPEVLDKWGRIFRKIRGLPETPYPVSEEAFETDFILRFGFKFCAPKGWDRTDPYNSDGAIYTHPSYDSVSIRGFGCNVVIEPTTLEGWVDSFVKAPQTKLLWIGESGTYLRDRHGRHKVRGMRVVYEKRDGRETYKSMARFVQEEARACVLCSAPKRLFGSFEEAFLHACNSLELSEPYWLNALQSAILEMTRKTRPTAPVKSAEVYAWLSRIHPELVLGTTQRELESELLGLEKMECCVTTPWAKDGKRSSKVRNW